MKWAFWISAALLVYTYAGYPVCLWVWSRWRRRPVRRAQVFPPVSVILAVHNEGAVLRQKLENLLAMHYPAGQLEVVVASDGSDDHSNQILETLPGVRCAILQSRQGKAVALNQAVALAHGEIILFTDARQMLEAEALERLAANFADPEVGCVSGELMLKGAGEQGQARGLGLYWELEKMIRRLEAEINSTVGATGALYAVRRRLIPELPPGTILDDVYIPMEVVRRGQRVIFEPQARAWDAWSHTEREFRRKVRTLAGNYQLVRLAPWLLTWKNPILFQFISHKVLRLASPFLMFAVLLSSLALSGIPYRVVLCLNLALFFLAAIGMQKPASEKNGQADPREEQSRGDAERAVGVYLGRAANAAFTFLMLNTAALVAFGYFVGRKRGVWVK
jgi:poly-beta-1,6-N-acetyl-D-glucosamine synthase